MTDSPPPSVHLSGSFAYPGKPLFEQLRLELPAGQWTCLLGSSGIGKSTLLKLFAGLPTGGEFDGTIAASDGLEVSPRSAYMGQSDLLFPWRSVMANVVLGQDLRGEKRDLERARSLLHQVGLDRERDHYPEQLSGGMRQRAALARTLMEDASIVLLDEPFSALDARTRREMQALAFKLLGNRTVLLVTHDPGEALRLAQQLLLMTRDGLEVQPIDVGPPLRAMDEARFVSAQATLLQRINQAD